jgi:WD40 repeat protein
MAFMPGSASAQAPGSPAVIANSGHSNSIVSLALPSNGAWLASGSDDSTIKLWDIAGGRLLRTLTGHSNQIKAIALTADGRTLISLSADNTIKVWEAQTGRELRPSLF